MRKDILYYDYAKKLTGEYQQTYEQMLLYIESASHAGNDISVIMNEVVDLLLSAQQDQRTIESIVGKDLKYFCDQILESHKHSVTDRLFQFLSFYHSLSLIAFLIEAFCIVIDYQDGIKNPWLSVVGMGGFVIAVALSLGILGSFKMIAKKLIFKYNWYTKKLDSLILSLLSIGLIISIIFLPEEINQYIAIPRWLFLPTMLIVFILCTIRKRKEKQKDIAEDNYYSYDEIAFNANLEELRKKYHRYLKKCQKKNIEPSSVNIWYEERFAKDMRGEKYGKVGFVLIILIAIIGTFLTSEFYDGIIFTIIFLCFEIFMYRLLNKGTLAKIKIYNIIHEKQTNIFDDNLFIEDIKI